MYRYFTLRVSMSFRREGVCSSWKLKLTAYNSDKTSVFGHFVFFTIILTT